MNWLFLFFLIIFRLPSRFNFSSSFLSFPPFPHLPLKILPNTLVFKPHPFFPFLLHSSSSFPLPWCISISSSASSTSLCVSTLSSHMPSILLFYVTSSSCFSVLQSRKKFLYSRSVYKFVRKSVWLDAERISSSQFITRCTNHEEPKLVIAVLRTFSVKYIYFKVATAIVFLSIN